MGGRVPFSDPRCFLPVTVYGTTVLVTVWGPSPNGLQLCRYIRTHGGVTQVDHESAQLSRPKSPESPDMWGMRLMENSISLVVYVRKSEGGWKKIRAIFFSYPPPPSGDTPKTTAGTPCRNFFSLGGISLLCAT